MPTFRLTLARSGARCALALCLLAAAATATAPVALAAVPTYGYTVKKSYPHDPGAFTQGLLYQDGFLYESTGMKGESSIRKVQLETGKVLMQQNLSMQYFGEGMTLVGDELVTLTWTSQVGFVYDLKTFALKRQFNYTGEGWGLANDGKNIYMSDGSAQIRVLEPSSLLEVRRFQVTADGIPVDQLNELEWVDGELYANIWNTDTIARIDAKTGKIVAWIDLTGLLPASARGSSADNVLNGIAYDSKQHRLFVTGKRWPKLFEIKLVKKR